MAFGRGSSRVIFTFVYLIVRSVPGLLVVLFRRDLSKDAELLVLRHENAVLHRHIGRVRYEPADRAWLSAPARLTLTRQNHRSPGESYFRAVQARRPDHPLPARRPPSRRPSRQALGSPAHAGTILPWPARFTFSADYCHAAFWSVSEQGSSMAGSLAVTGRRMPSTISLPAGPWRSCGRPPCAVSARTARRPRPPGRRERPPTGTGLPAAAQARLLPPARWLHAPAWR